MLALATIKKYFRMVSRLEKNEVQITRPKKRNLAVVVAGFAGIGFAGAGTTGSGFFGVGIGLNPTCGVGAATGVGKLVAAGGGAAYGTGTDGLHTRTE